MINQTGPDLPLSPFPVSLPSYQPDTPDNLVVDIDVWATGTPVQSATTTAAGEDGNGLDPEEALSSDPEQAYEGDFDYAGSDLNNDPPTPSTFFCGNPSKFLV